jgi:hypothetical protein
MRLFQGFRPQASSRPPQSGPATRENADQHSGYNGASKSPERIAFGHRFEFRRKRGDLLRRRLGHVAGRRGGVVDHNLPAVRVSVSVG